MLRFFINGKEISPSEKPYYEALYRKYQQIAGAKDPKMIPQADFDFNYKGKNVGKKKSKSSGILVYGFIASANDDRPFGLIMGSG